MGKGMINNYVRFRCLSHYCRASELKECSLFDGTDWDDAVNRKVHISIIGSLLLKYSS